MGVLLVVPVGAIGRWDETLDMRAGVAPLPRPCAIADAGVTSAAKAMPLARITAVGFMWCSF